MLWFHKKSFSFDDFLESKNLSTRTNTDLHNNPFLFSIGHHKLVLLIGINDIDALVSQEKLFFQPFFRIKVHLSTRTNIDSHINLFIFMIGLHKLILLVGINDMEALLFYEMLIFPPFSRIKVHLWIGTNTDLDNNLLFFHDWDP